MEERVPFRDDCTRRYLERVRGLGPRTSPALVREVLLLVDEHALVTATDAGQMLSSARTSPVPLGDGEAVSPRCCLVCV